MRTKVTFHCIILLVALVNLKQRCNLWKGSSGKGSDGDQCI